MIVAHIGISGAGKTYALKHELWKAARADAGPTIVIDQMRELASCPPDLATVTVLAETIDEATAALAGETTIAIVAGSLDPARDVEAACEWALKNRGTVVVPEIQMVAPPGSATALSPSLRKMVCAWRHHGCRLLCDTQRVSLVNRTIFDLAQRLRVFAVVGDRDHAVLRDLGTKDLSDAAYEAATRLESGEPGWHISLGLIRRGPYTLERYAP